MTGFTLDFENKFDVVVTDHGIAVNPSRPDIAAWLDAAVGGVVQRPLQPLNGGGHGRVHGVGHQVAAQGADALGAHGVALVGHGAGADLVLFEGLLHLPVMLLVMRKTFHYFVSDIGL